MGGGFGRKARPDYAGGGAAVSLSWPSGPVDLVREEDVRQDFYRPAVQSRFRAAFDSSDRLVAWENTYTNKNEPIEAPLISTGLPRRILATSAVRYIFLSSLAQC